MRRSRCLTHENRCASARAEWLERRALLSVSLLKDINTVPITAASPEVVAGNSVYFAGVDFTNGQELWKSDGTVSGTHIVKDINPGAADSAPANLNADGSSVYFSATDGKAPLELWKSDGTESGTALVSTLGGDWSFSPQMVPVGNMLFFQLYDAGRTQLWKTDGTPAGTVMLQECPYYSSDYVTQFRAAAVGNELYFIVNFYTAGDQLWKTDGTTAGTVLVSNPAPGSFMYNLTPFEGKLLYTVTDYKSGQGNVWISDGSTAGTQPLSSFSLASGAHLTDLVASGNRGFFRVWYPAGGDGQIWTTDGTPADTGLLRDTGPDLAQPGYPRLMASGGNLFFTANDDSEIWRFSAITHAFTQLATGLSHVSQLTGSSGIAYFNLTSSTASQIWKSDGTPQGTGSVPGTTAAQIGSSPSNFVVLGNSLFFEASSGVWKLWITDGTATQALAQFLLGTASSTPDQFSSAGDLAYFTTSSPQGFWRSDGTAQGTFELSSTIQPRTTADLNGILVFSAIDRNGLAGLWRSDGTLQGTYQISPIQTYTIEAVNGTVFFDHEEYNSAAAATTAELWKTDGTPQGTVEVAQLATYRGPAFPPRVTDIGAAGPLVYFILDVAGQGTLWRSDGTAQGTFPVKTNLPTPPGALNFGSDLMYVGGKEYFFVGGKDYFFSATQLWDSNGLPSGTALVKDLGTAGPLPPGTGLGNLLLAYVWEPGLGNTVWRSDGTASGTYELAGVTPWPTLNPSPIAVLGNRAYFFAPTADPNNLWGLYQTDATSAGTVLVKQLSALPHDFLNAHGRLFFVAGHDLLQTDGTPAGTLSVGHIDRDPAADTFYDTGRMASAGDTVIFHAYNTSYGYEAWRLDRSDNTGTISGSVFNDLNHNGSLDGGESGLAGITAYIYANNNGQLDLGETSATTDSTGTYAFDGLFSGSFVIRQITPEGDAITSPLGYSATVEVSSGAEAAGPTFGDVSVQTVPMDLSYLVALARHYGQAGTFADGDLNGDGKVDFSDLVILARNFGHALSAGTTAAAVNAAALRPTVGVDALTTLLLKSRRGGRKIGLVS